MTNSQTVGISDEVITPSSFSLLQNYPNPFNPSTVIRYTIPETGFVKLKILNILGQEIRTLVNATQTAGEYKITFNAQNLSAGVYFYRLETGTFTQTKKLILLK